MLYHPLLFITANMTTLSCILALAAYAGTATADTARYPTPPMGWNSYNAYNCFPTEELIEANAQGLVNLGLAELGYNSVTVDCGWPTPDRDSSDRLQWNETLFPSGGKALGDFIHDLGLKFGLYSGGGYLQCGSEDLPASLGVYTAPGSHRCTNTAATRLRGDRRGILCRVGWRLPEVSLPFHW